MQIIPIESGDLLEPLDIAQCQTMVGQRNQLVPPHLLQDAVYMHGGQAKRVGEFGLCQRQLDRIIRTQPNRPRIFKVPLVPWFPLISIILCGGLMTGLTVITWGRFIGWLVLGLLIYYFYSRHRSEFARK